MREPHKSSLSERYALKGVEQPPATPIEGQDARTLLTVVYRIATDPLSLPKEALHAAALWLGYTQSLIRNNEEAMVMHVTQEGTTEEDTEVPPLKGMQFWEN